MGSLTFRVFRFVGWRVTKWYVRHTLERVVPSRRRLLLAGVAGSALAAALAVMLSTRHQRA